MTSLTTSFLLIAVLTTMCRDGSVLVQITYQIRQSEGDKFVQALSDVRLNRLRDGAFRWDVFYDHARPGRCVETFEVASWAEHLRQYDRATVAD